MRCLPLLLAALLVGASPATALSPSHGSSHSTYSSHSKGSSHSSAPSHNSTGHPSAKTSASHTHYSAHHKAQGVQRDFHGKIKRDPEQRSKFMHSHPCPSTGRTSGACPGYVVDHVKALKHGGRDEPSNMHWQTVTDAKAKDKLE